MCGLQEIHHVPVHVANAELTSSVRRVVNVVHERYASMLDGMAGDYSSCRIELVSLQDSVASFDLIGVEPEADVVRNVRRL